MPRYEYRCYTCDFTWERTRPIVDDVGRDQCPKCKKFMPQLISGGSGVNGFAGGDGADSAYDALV